MLMPFLCVFVPVAIISCWARFACNSAQVCWQMTDTTTRARACADARTIDCAGATSDPNMQFAHVCATVLQQSHLCPLPLEGQPVYWQHDAALQLYPVPDALIIADSAPMAAHTFAACACMNPVSPGFSGYLAPSQTIERCLQMALAPNPMHFRCAESRLGMTMSMCCACDWSTTRCRIVGMGKKRDRPSYQSLQ